MTGSWTSIDELVDVVRKRWERGQYAQAYAAGEAWESVGLPIRAPSAADVLQRFDEVRRWAEHFERERRDAQGRDRFRVEYRTVQSRQVGANRVPSRIFLDSVEQLCALIGTTSALRDLERVVSLTSAELPAATPWVVAHPLIAAEHADVWERILATVAWIERNPTSLLYLRQLDVPAVDTKFVERYRKVLDGLLTVVLPLERIDLEAPQSDFVRRFRFRPKPEYVRLRFLCPQPALPSAITEVRLRSDEFPGAGIRASTVFIVENEVSYLALPAVHDAVVIFGSGYGLEAANAGAWLADRSLVYWGDIDTHGFAILDAFRARFPNVISFLMDAETLLCHAAQWVREPVPTSRVLTHLNDAEEGLYRDLIEDRYGRSVRLEQERVRFSLVHQALELWTRSQSSWV